MPEIQTGLREPQPVCSRIHAVGGDVRLLGGRALVEREHARRWGRLRLCAPEWELVAVHPLHQALQQPSHVRPPVSYLTLRAGTTCLRTRTVSMATKANHATRTDHSALPPPLRRFGPQHCLLALSYILRMGGGCECCARLYQSARPYGSEVL